MPTSGTTSFDLDVLDICEDAFEICGMELRTGYDLRSARRSLDLLLQEWGNRGLNLWTIEQTTLTLSEDDSSVDLPASTIDIIEATIRLNSGDTDQSDYPLERISVSMYSNVVNKNVTGRPTQYWVHRKSTPTIHVWPVPDQDYELVYYRLRRMQDSGAGTNTVDIPSRFLPALVYGLAYYVGMKHPAVTDRLPMIKMEYDRQFEEAAAEDRERASLWIRPYAIR